MPFDLKTIDERLAKAKEDAEFWERARSILADPRLKEVSAPDSPVPAETPEMAKAPMPKAYGGLQNGAYLTLPPPGTPLLQCLTTRQIVDLMRQGGFQFESKEPMIAVNGALVTLMEKRKAESAGYRGNARLWRKKKSQEAPEGAS